MGELSRRLTYKGVEKAHGIGHETVRKFVEYDPSIPFGTRQPHPRQLRKYRQLYMEAHPEGFVLERKSDGTEGSLPPLKTTLPGGEQQATETVRELFRRAREHPDGLPKGADPLEGWLEKVLRAQYAVEAKYETKRKKKDE